MSDVTALSQETRSRRAAVVRLGGRIWAIPAAQVLKVLPHQTIRPSPGLAASVLGVVAYAGEVLPLLDLRAMLKIESRHDGGELLLVEIAGEKYTVPVDQVLQVLTVDEDEFLWRGEKVGVIDLSDLLAQTLSARVAATTNTQAMQAPEQTAPADIADLPALHEIRAATAASLVVDIENSRERLPLYSVVELCETLPIVAVPDPNPLFHRAALYRDTLIPVVSLDALLGHPTSGGEKDGAFVAVDIVGRRCALSVVRVVGMSNEPAAITDLRGLLLDQLPDGEAEFTASSAIRRHVGVETQSRFLIVEAAGRVCGFALDSVAHIHPAGHVAPTPPLPHAQKLDVTALGGRVVPVLHLAQELDLQETARPQHFIEFKSKEAEAFVVAVDRVRGIAAIERKSLLAPPQGSKINAIVKNGADAPMIWIIDPASFLTGAEGSSNAA
jgi:chemotaxis signal transduction protein